MTADTAANITEQAKRLQLAETLLHVSHTVSALDTLDEVLTALVELTVRETDADRGTLFLNDPTTGELYSRIAQGDHLVEIRFLNDTGIAGRVFTTHESLIINNAYADPRFNRDIDEFTGYTTRSIVCAPVTTAKGEVIGVAQVLNKKSGAFDRDDLSLLEAMTSQASAALLSTRSIEQVDRRRAEEMEFLRLVSDITAELDLDTLLQRVMAEATRMLHAERSTLFLHDERTRELFARVAEGDSVGEIRFPESAGIAGSVFTTGRSINIAHAYADLRFNPEFDRQTGFFTRSILCVPVITNDGHVIGVTQVLNKRGGPSRRKTSNDSRRSRRRCRSRCRTPSSSTTSRTCATTAKPCSRACRTASSPSTRPAPSRPATTAASRILGGDQASVVGRHFSDVFGDADAVIGALVTRAADGGVRDPQLAMDVDLPRLTTRMLQATTATRCR